MPGEHSLFSPSSAERWFACPGSLRLGEGDNESSEYAREGTAAHSLASSCWLLGVSPASRLGEVIEVEGSSFTVGEEMVEAVQIFLDEVERQSEGADFVEPERRIIHKNRPDFGGTVDFTAVKEGPGGWIRVIDLKYGAGVPVSAEGNLQLLLYLVLATHTRSNEARTYGATIVQPRLETDDGFVRDWIPTVEEIKDITGKLVDLWEAYDRGDELPFNAGSHCRWCPHKVNCPALEAHTNELASQEFSLAQVKSGELLEGMTVEKALAFRDKRKAIESFLESVDKWLHGQMDKGVEVPGLKLVESYGNRTWSLSEEEILKKLRNRKIPKSKTTVAKLLSPAQMEKVVDKELVEALCHKPKRGTVVVSLSDKREAVKRLTASEEFSDFTEGSELL